MTTRAQKNKAEWLRLKWLEAVALCERHEGTFGSAEAEQKAYDALIEHVEANDLNHTSYDPRP